MVGKEVVERLFVEHALAVVQLDDVLGRLALAEAVDGEAAARLHIRLLICFIPLCLVEGDGDLDGALFSVLYLVIHKLLLIFPTVMIVVSDRIFSPNYFNITGRERKAFLFTILLFSGIMTA